MELLFFEFFKKSKILKREFLRVVMIGKKAAKSHSTNDLLYRNGCPPGPMRSMDRLNHFQDCLQIMTHKL